LRTRLYGEKAPLAVESGLVLLRALNLLDQLAEAEPLARRLAELSREVHGEKHPTYGTILSTLSYVCWKLDKRPESEALMVRSIDTHRQAFGEKHRLVNQGLYQLADYLLIMGFQDRAERLARRVLALILEMAGEGSLGHAEALLLVGKVQSDQHK